MSNQRDVFEDNTAPGNQQSGSGQGSPATTYQAGDRPFKSKGKPRAPGYKHTPGAGENPAKIDS